MSASTNGIAIPNEDVIQAYGEASELFETHRCFAINERLLPYPKHIIKQAILQALAAEKDEDVRFILTQGYKNLAAWRSLDSMFVAHITPDDFSELSDNVRAENTLDRMDETFKLKATITAEAIELEKELFSFLGTLNLVAEQASQKSSTVASHTIKPINNDNGLRFNQIGPFIWLLFMLLLVMLIVSGGLK